MKKIFCIWILTSSILYVSAQETTSTTSESKVSKDKEQLWNFLYSTNKETNETKLKNNVDSIDVCDTIKVVYNNYDQPFYTQDNSSVNVVVVGPKNDCDSLKLANAKSKEFELNDNQLLMATLINDSIKEKVSMDSIKVSNARDYENILNNYGFYDFLDVTFRVQVGAFKNKDSFDKGVFNPFGTIREYTLNDGITRFTVGDYSYLRQADDLKKKIRLAGSPDVFVVVFKNGKRQFDFNFEQ